LATYKIFGGVLPSPLLQASRNSNSSDDEKKRATAIVDNYFHPFFYLPFQDNPLAINQVNQGII
jgi:hypothetical protein